MARVNLPLKSDIPKANKKIRELLDNNGYENIRYSISANNPEHVENALNVYYIRDEYGQNVKPEVFEKFTGISIAALLEYLKKQR